MKKINIQKIEFTNGESTVILFGCVKNHANISESKILIQQSELNKIINKIQASTEDPEDNVLDYMNAFEINDDEIIYTIDLQRSNFYNQWITLDGYDKEITMIRA